FAGIVATSTSATSTLETFSGLYLAKNIMRVATLPTSEEFLYSIRDGSGMALMRAQWDGTKQKRIFSSVIGSWNISWIADGRIILLESPADEMSGHAYELKSDGSLSSLASGLGLTILPRPSSRALLFGTS